jgi:2'-5' RNA ligase
MTVPVAFPQTPPSNTRDATTIRAHDWAAFDDVEEMVNHWDRPGWSASTRVYYWMLCFPDVQPLVDQVRQCQSELQPLGFDHVEEDGLHLTLGRVCRVSETTPSHVHRLISAARKAVPPAFTFQALPLTASRGAIRYSVAPWNPVIELHKALSSAGAEVELPLRRPTSSLRPHVGIAYCNRRMSAELVRRAVRPLRDLDAVDVPVQQVALVELRREGRAYRWQLIHVVELRSAAQEPCR